MTIDTTEEICTEPKPNTISFYRTPFTDNTVAHCSECDFRSVFWDCFCELEHDCDEYKGEK